MRRLLGPVLLAVVTAFVLATAGCGDGTSGSAGDEVSEVAPSAPSAPSAGQTPDQPSAELTSVTDDALRVTPALEQHFFGAGYAANVDEAVAALGTIGLELSPGNTVGGYTYDDADEDFKLCIEGPTGAHATYDTSPMSLFDTGASGGCPA